MADAITVQVALRIRPLVDSEIHRGCRKCLQSVSEENQVQVLGTDKAFTFNFVFDETISQLLFYEQAVKHMVANLFKGFNVTILAYGQTGSGKTHSMGTCYDGIGEMGVIPRAIIDIFQYIEINSDKYDFRVSVSFMELYKENLFDLLSNKPREQNIIDIREDTKGIKMPGLTEKVVTSISETTRCLIEGSAGRATGATAMNAQSSRSHAIFTITVFMAKKGNEDSATTAKFHLVDLAGSERSKKTKATGERFKEGVNINKGLLALGNVISALGEESQKGFISYRDSKLTRLLQDSLGGNSMTLMIACVSPADYNLEETLSTLRYADRARKIKNKPIVNQDPKAAEIARLNQLVHSLRLQIIGDGGAQITSEELTKIKEENTKLQAKNRELNSALSLALADNTNMFERQLLTQMANERLKKKLLELQETCNVTLSNISLTIGQANECPDNIKEQIEKLHDMQNMITDIHCEHKKNEEELINHEFQTQPKTPISANCNYAEDIDERQETHTKEQLNLNMELQELNRQLALKEQLASQIISNNNHMVDYVILSENEKKVSVLEKEKEELMQQLKNVRTSDNCSKLAEQRRQRVKELETQITELNRKVVEQARLIKLKEKGDLKIKQLNSEIQIMKTNKVKLIKNMRTEEQKFRAWKQQREKDLIKLKDQDRKRQNQMVKMEHMHQKQQIVLKRKVEEAIAINKRLKFNRLNAPQSDQSVTVSSATPITPIGVRVQGKYDSLHSDALALQKIAQDRRGQNYGKTERIQQWVAQELEVMVSTVDAERSLEQLVEDRAVLSEQLENYRNNPDNSDPVEVEEQIKQLTADIDIRSAQIADLQQKIIDSDQENKSKTRWETVQSMVEAKCALKQLFDLAADIRRKHINTEYKYEELNIVHKEALDKLADYEKDLKELNRLHTEHVSQIVKDNEDKVTVLLKQLRGIKTGSEDESINERLKIQEQALERMEAMQNELEDYRLKVEELEDTIKQIKQVSQMSEKLNGTKDINKPKKKQHLPTDVTFVKEEYDMDTSVEFDDDNEKDPDWRKTPMHKRIQLRHRLTKVPEPENAGDRLTVKRSSDGSTKCSCKGSCKSKLCGCRKLLVTCSDLCKCVNCKNRDDTQLNKTHKIEETDSEDSFKRPRILFQNNDDNLTFTTPLKYKKSYFKVEEDSINDKQ